MTYFRRRGISLRREKLQKRDLLFYVELRQIELNWFLKEAEVFADDQPYVFNCALPILGRGGTSPYFEQKLSLSFES